MWCDVLLAYGVPDQAMAGAAVVAAICGLVLMGGRTFVGGPLRFLSQVCVRSPKDGTPDRRVVLGKIDSGATVRRAA
jgi:hypothetical protein